MRIALATLAVLTLATGSAGAEDCKPARYSWNPLNWAAQDAGARAGCATRRMVEDFNALSPEQRLAVTAAAKAQGGGDARTLLLQLPPAARSDAPPPAPRPSRNLDQATR